jgi:osmotically-inducible protein OsmY
MWKKRSFVLYMTSLVICLTSCSGANLWTGASLIYDRHHVYKKLDDYHLYAKVNKALTLDKLFKNPHCALDLAVFNGDILITGHLPTVQMRAELQRRLNQIKGYRRLFNEVRVGDSSSNVFSDSWITAKIRSQIFADSSIDPNAFKVITSDGIVYLMGDVRLNEANQVVTIARCTTGVVRVVKVFKYLVYQQ